MPALITSKFRLHNASQFKEMFDEKTDFSAGTSADDSLNSNIYLFIGKSDGWNTETGFSDTNVPDPNISGEPGSDTTQNTEVDFWSDMIAAKKIASSDVSHVINRINYTEPTYTQSTGFQYFQMYDDTVNTETLLVDTELPVNNGTTDTTSIVRPMYVINSNFGVYKCLYNNKTLDNKPRPSTVEPTSVNTESSPPLALSDGYIWKYMYTITASEALKFITDTYIPVKQLRNKDAFGAGSITGENDNGSDQVEIERNSINGSIDILQISNQGTLYHFENPTIYTASDTEIVIVSPALTTNDDYINSSIYFIIGGTSYVRKVISSIYSNTGGIQIQTLTLDSGLGVEIPSGNPIVAQLAPYLTIIGDGTGANIVAVKDSVNTTQIASYLVVNAGQNYNHAKINVERQGMIIATGGIDAIIRPILPPRGGHGYNPIFELGGYYIMLATKLSQDESGTFTVTNDFRKIGLLKDPNNVDTFTRCVKDSIRQTTVFTGQLVPTGIYSDTTLTQLATEGTSVSKESATAYIVDILDVVGSATSKYMRVNRITNGTSDIIGYDGSAGSFQSGTKIQSGLFEFDLTTIEKGELEVGSGELLYIENRSPIARNSAQSENIKLIIEF